MKIGLFFICLTACTILLLLLIEIYYKLRKDQQILSPFIHIICILISVAVGFFGITSTVILSVVSREPAGVVLPFLLAPYILAGCVLAGILVGLFYRTRDYKLIIGNEKTMNKILSVVILCVGFFVTYSVYSLGESGNLQSYKASIPLSVAAVFAVSVSAKFYKKPNSHTNNFLSSAKYSYLLYFALLLLASLTRGSMTEVIMWSPVIILFAIPFMFPLTGAAWLSVYYFFKDNDKVR